MADVKKVGVRALQQNASYILRSARDGQVFEVTVQGQDTGVYIGAPPPAPPVSPRSGATLDQIQASPLYRRSVPDGTNGQAIS